MLPHVNYLKMGKFKFIELIFPTWKSSAAFTLFLSFPIKNKIYKYIWWDNDHLYFGRKNILTPIINNLKSIYQPRFIIIYILTNEHIFCRSLAGINAWKRKLRMKLKLEEKSHFYLHIYNTYLFSLFWMSVRYFFHQTQITNITNIKIKVVFKKLIQI